MGFPAMNFMTNKQASDKQEKMIADYLGWKQVSGSGARPNHPGDILGEEWMGECKTHTTPNHKIIFKKSVWDKLCEESSSRFKFPAYFSDDGSQKYYNTWVVFNEMQLPNDSYSVTPLDENIGVSFSFSDRPKCVQPFDDLTHKIFSFSFETSHTTLSYRRGGLYLTLLGTFRDIINLE